MASNPPNILADSIAYLPDLAAFDLMFKDRLDNIGLENALVYLIDTVDASALPYLAKQFDVLGFKGLMLATTIQQTRDIIKQAIALHRYKGTPWAVRQALVSIGYGDAVLTEGVEGYWANFSISLELGGQPLGPNEINNIVGMVNEYKNTRSWLSAVEYSFALDDTLGNSDDSFSLEPGFDNSDSLTVGAGRFHDGTYKHDGAIDHSKDSDILIIEIQNV